MIGGGDFRVRTNQVQLSGQHCRGAPPWAPLIVLEILLETYNYEAGFATWGNDRILNAT